VRILHVIDHFYPELGYQETFLSMTETSQGHDVTVLTGNLIAKDVYEANRDFINSRKTKIGQSIERGVKTIRLPALRLPIVDNLYLLGMEEAIAGLKPEFIICHGVTFLTSVRLARLKHRFPNVKLIYDDHMTYNATRGGIFYRIYYLFKLMLTPTILRSADRIIAVTPETRDFMERVYGIPREDIEVIPLGVDTTLFRRDLKAREEIRARYGIRDEDIVFMYSGKIVPEKGPHLLIGAALKMIAEHSNVATMLVGGGKNHYRGLLIEKTSSSRFSHNFIFVSSVPNKELFRYFSAADVGVWPLQCSISMLEAMSCGLPVIISDKSGALERINNGNGLMYREGDIEDLAEKMETLLDPKTRKTMSLRALKFAKENDWNTVSARFLSSVDI
jgi:glycosyltransferase involved in cell wall biosynthesis